MTHATHLHRPRALAALAVVASTAGCSGFIERQAASSTYRILEKSMVVARRQADVELARDAMPGGMLQLEAFALAYPDHQGFRTMYAAAACQYATGFVFDDWEDAKLAGRDTEAAHLAERLGPLLERCVDANLALLPTTWRTARASGPDAVTALLPSATRAQAPALLWLASADVVRLGLDPMAHLAELPMLTSLLARCSALAPELRDGSAEVMIGTLDAARSAVFGGDDGSAHFAKARTLAGEGSLIIDVMYARGVAVARKDRALLEATLGRVLEADPRKWPERRLGNELARRKARRYLAAAATLIPDRE